MAEHQPVRNLAAQPVLFKEAKSETIWNIWKCSAETFWTQGQPFHVRELLKLAFGLRDLGWACESGSLVSLSLSCLRQGVGNALEMPWGLWHRNNGFLLLCLYGFVAQHFSGKMSRQRLKAVYIDHSRCHVIILGIWSSEFRTSQKAQSELFCFLQKKLHCHAAIGLVLICGPIVSVACGIWLEPYLTSHGS